MGGSSQEYDLLVHKLSARTAIAIRVIRAAARTGKVTCNLEVKSGRNLIEMRTTSLGVSTRCRGDTVSAFAGCIATRDSSRYGLEDATVLISQRLKAGDPYILSELIAQSHDRLLRYVRHLNGNRDPAADLSQDVWLCVLTHGGNSGGRLGPLRGCAQLRATADLSSRQRPAASKSLRAMEECERRVEIRSQEEGPFEHCAELEDARILFEAVHTPKPEDREVVKLRYHCEMTLDEIA